MNSQNLSRLSYDVFLAAGKHFAMDTMSYGQGKGSYLQVNNLPVQKWACSTVQLSQSFQAKYSKSHQRNFCHCVCVCVCVCVYMNQIWQQQN